MRLLVTGAAGFIGSNFVRYWLERRPDDHVVAYDLLTYAGVRENVPEGVPFVQGDIADLELAEQTLAEHDLDVVVNFAAESHNSLAVQDPALFARTNVLGTQQLLEASRRQGVDALPPHLDVRGLRRPRTGLRRVVLGGVALPPADAVQRVEGRGRPLRAVVLRDLRAADDDHELLEQLRAVPVPGEGDPALHDARAGRPPLPLYASTQNKREWLHVLDHCRAIELVLEQGEPARRTTWAQASSARSRRSPMPCSSSRQGRVAQDDRPRPAGARPALPARLVEAPRARLVGRDRLGRRDRADRALVRGEPRLVGAATRPRPGRRSRLALVARGTLVPP